MTGEMIGALVAGGTAVASAVIVIFKVGGQYAKFQIQLAEVEKAAVERDARLRQEQSERYQKLLNDLNGIGASLRALRILSDRRYHNSTMVHLVNSQAAVKLKIAGMLREEVGS